MWNESKMPARWYELLRERMRVTREHMRAIKEGNVVEGDRMDELLTVAQNLDRQMQQVMRQAVAEVLAHEALAIERWRSLSSTSGMMRGAAISSEVADEG